MKPPTSRPAAEPVAALGWLAFGLCFVPLFVLAWRYAAPADQAAVPFEYAKNLLERGLITFGGASGPIGGATDFLWMLLIALLRRLGLSEFGAALLLNFAALALLFQLFRAVHAGLALLVAAAATPFLYAALAGFGVLFFSAAFVLSLRLALGRSRALYPSLLLLCLIRPDGIVWSAGLVLYRLREAGSSPARRAEWTALLGALVLPGLAYLAWRRWYFGELLPLPLLVKAAGQRDLLLFHADSLVEVMQVAVPGFVALLVFRGRGLLEQYLLTFGLPILFYSALRLEQNVGNRFMAPLFFGSLFLIAARARSRLALLLFLLASVLLQADLLWETARSVARSGNETMLQVAQDLRQLHGRLLGTEAGRLAYYSGWVVEDSWGLNTPRFAQRLVEPADIAAGGYDLVVAHCDLTLLDPGADLQRSGARQWHEQCKSIVEFLVAHQYRIFLVPAFDEGPTLLQRLRLALGVEVNRHPPGCARYEVYAVAPGYAQLAELEALLLRHGGLAYSPQIRKGGGDLVCF